MISGMPLLGHRPAARLRVWLFNAEDPRDEIQRRVTAAAVHYGISPDLVESGLLIGSGRDAPLVIAEQSPSGARINRPNMEALALLFREQEIDVAIIDPFVSTHRVSENDNGAIDAVVKEWALLAGDTRTAIDLVHHARKRSPGSDAETTAEDARGGSAIIAAVRNARVLNPMSEAEATKAGIDNRFAFFKVSDGKANLAPRSDKADWYRFVSVPLGNGADGGQGDSVGVVTPWHWPDHRDGVTADDLLTVQRAVEGGRWRENGQAKDWVGNAVAAALGLDLSRKSEKAKVISLLRMWIAAGALVVVEGEDAKRNRRAFVEVGAWVNLAPETFQ